MKIIYFYAPHFIDSDPEKAWPNYLDKTVHEILNKTDPNGVGGEDVFCILADPLTQPLPVGTVVKFATIKEGAQTVDFRVTEIFTVPDVEPSVIFLELQIKECDEISVDELLNFLREKHDSSREYRFWG